MFIYEETVFLRLVKILNLVYLKAPKINGVKKQESILRFVISEHCFEFRISSLYGRGFVTLIYVIKLFFKFLKRKTVIEKKKNMSSFYSTFKGFISKRYQFVLQWS